MNTPDAIMTKLIIEKCKIPGCKMCESFGKEDRVISDILNRFRNIVAALDNLLTQLGDHDTTFKRSVEQAREFYQSEMEHGQKYG